MSPRLHVVVFNVPWPPNYGGVIDAWYRLQELARAGLALHIHVFDYGRGRAAELERLGRVFYYPRRPPWTALLSAEPYIVSSRASVDLLNRLLADEAPILFDGLHTCHYLADPQLAGRRKVVRMHNIEWQYYAGLAHSERRMMQEWYFREESRRLRRYEAILDRADAVACISPADWHYYREQLGDRAFYLPAFHPFERVEGRSGRGSYALYHGNLSVPENIQAASFLLRLWRDMPLPLVLAGLDPDYKLHELARDNPQVRIEADPDEARLSELVTGAQLHVLPAFQRSGIKLKLLRALFQGRYVLVSPDMVEGTGLEAWCSVLETEAEWVGAVRALAEAEFTDAQRDSRLSLEALFSNRQNAVRLMQSLFAPRLQ